MNDCAEIGSGFGGRIIVDPRDGDSCLKIPTETDPDRAFAQLVQEHAISEVVAGAGVPYIPLDLVCFNGQWCARMPNLTRDGSLIISAPDVDRARRDGDLEMLQQFCAARPIYDADGFFQELASIMQRTSRANIEHRGRNIESILIGFTGFMLTVSPAGRLGTVLGDYHDGLWPQREGYIEVGNLDLPEHYSGLIEYLATVCLLVPQLHDTAAQFLACLCPPSCQSLLRRYEFAE